MTNTVEKDGKAMEKVGSKAGSFCRKMSAWAVGFLFMLSILSVNVSALAYDDRYVGREEFWADKGEYIEFTKPNIIGQLRYVLDETDGCAYFYLLFQDTKLSSSVEDFYLTFTVENEQNQYVFSVNSAGVEADAEYHIADNFEIYSDFSGLHSQESSYRPE